MRALAQAALLLSACGLAAGQEIPDHPDRLVFKPLRFEVPDPASMRVEIPGGTVAYLIEDFSLPVVDLRLYFPGGSFHEPRGKEGLADLTAGLLRTGGTESRSPEALDEELDFLAADLGIEIADVYGSVSLSILAKDLDRGLEILFDILRRPAFRADKLQVLKAQTLDALRGRNDSTAAIETRELNLLVYGPEHPINRLETKASIEAITREDAAAFHRKLVHPSRFVVAAAGAFRKEAFAAALGRAARDWPWEAAPLPAVPPPSHVPTPGVYRFHKEGRNITQGRVTAAHLGVDVHHPEVQAIRVMSYILGAGGFSSRLMQRVRTQEGLAYDVGSDFRPGFTYPLPFRISFQSKNESVAVAAKLCLAEVARLREEGVSEKELADAVRFYLDAFPGLFFATRFRTVTTYAQAELLNFPKDYYATYREKIARLTTEDVRRAAREHLRPERFVWVVVGNVPAIERGDPSRPAALSDLGPVFDVSLPDPLTLERPK
jgi:predicted Zn-dependent peptidase